MLRESTWAVLTPHWSGPGVCSICFLLEALLSESPMTYRQIPFFASSSPDTVIGLPSRCLIQTGPMRVLLRNFTHKSPGHYVLSSLRIQGKWKQDPTLAQGHREVKARPNIDSLGQVRSMVPPLPFPVYINPKWIYTSCLQCSNT